MTARWFNKLGDFKEMPAVDAFIEEIVEVCKRHGLSISHEDGHGAFEIHPYDEFDADWLRNAHWAGEETDGGIA